MSDMLKSIWFAAITALISSFLLTGASLGLKPYRLTNIKLDNQKNLLKSVGLITADGSYSDDEIQALYQDNIEAYRVGDDGSLIPVTGTKDTGQLLFLYLQDREIRAYILPVHSRGLWGQIDGYLALEKDGRTVAGFTVYHHSETPGLGGEIEKDWFQQNFHGKQIVDSDGYFVSVGIAKGRVAERIAPQRQANYVDGISGATLTGRFLTQGLRDTLLAYENVSAAFRAGQINLNPDETH